MRLHRAKTAALLLSPLMAGIIVFFMIPFVILVYYSLTFGVGGAEFVGFSNYIDMLQSQSFKLAFGNTVRFLLLGVCVNMILSFVLASMLQERFVGAKLFRSVILFPMFLPVAAVVTVVLLFFSDTGIVNDILQKLGLPVKDWIRSSSAFGLVLGLSIFKNIGYNVILVLAGLNMIPKDLYELADMEGAGPMQKVFHITLPMLTPTLFFVFIISIMNCFKSFREIFILGGEHPDSSIYMLPHFINNNIKNLNYQRLAVASVLIVFTIVLFTAFIYWGETKLEERL
jgi:multiple sugar transport system permease protein